MSACLLGACVGRFLGVLAGYFGNWVDTIISRFIDVPLAFPGLLLAITIVAILGAGTQNTMYAIAIFGIPNICRMVRGYVIRLKKSEHVEAAIVMGSSHPASSSRTSSPMQFADHRQRNPEFGHGDSNGFFPFLPRPGRYRALSGMGRHAVYSA